jgi:hypothetical protein
MGIMVVKKKKLEVNKTTTEREEVKNACKTAGGILFSVTQKL